MAEVVVDILTDNEGEGTTEDPPGAEERPPAENNPPGEADP